jgi:hypothetical protein
MVMHRERKLEVAVKLRLSVAIVKPLISSYFYVRETKSALQGTEKGPREMSPQREEDVIGNNCT